MANETKITLGTILITLLLTGVIIFMPDAGLKFKVDEDKSTFYVQNENNRWTVAGREINKLINGTTNLNRDKSGIIIEEMFRNESGLFVYRDNKIANYSLLFNYSEKDNLKVNSSIFRRYTTYIKGPVIIDTWTFDGSNTDIERFPISHPVEVINATGLYYQYNVKDLTYDGQTFKLDGKQTEQSFGKNMKVTWWDDYRLGWVYSNGNMYVKSEKIDSDYVKFDVRLFDPTSGYVNVSLNGVDSSRDYELGTTAIIDVTTNASSAVLCLSIDEPRYGNDYKCVTDGNLSLEFKLDNIAYDNTTTDATSVPMFFADGNSTVVNLTYYSDGEFEDLQFALSSVNIPGVDTYCLQEQANESTACGGLDTGVYWNTSNGVTDMELSYDNDYDTAYTTPANAVYANIYINYTKPAGATSAIGQVKDADYGLNNRTIPAACFDAFTDVVAVAHFVYQEGSDYSRYACKNAAGAYITVFGPDTPGLTPSLYEEAIYWIISSNDYTENLSIDILNDDVVDYKIHGKLGKNGTDTSVITSFTDGESGEFIMYKNEQAIKEITVSGNAEDFLTYQLFNITLTGAETDPVAYELNEHFINTTYINASESNGSYPEYIYEDYSAGEVSGRWDGSYSTYWETQATVSNNSHIGMNSNNCGGGTCVSQIREEATGSVWTSDIDLKDSKKINFSYYLYARGTEYPCMYGGDGSASSSIGIRDSLGNVNTINDVSATFGDTSTTSAEVIVEFRDNMYIYVNGVSKWQYYSDRDYYLYGSGYAAGGYNTCGNSDLRIYNITLSGLTGNYTGNLTWNDTGTIVTHNLFNSTVDIVRAKLTTYKHNTAGGDEYLYLSATNDTPTWEVTSSGNFHTFTNAGKQLRAKIVVNITDNDAPYIVDYYTLEIIPGTINNLTVDVGNDGRIDGNISGLLDDTQVLLANVTDIQSYINLNCPNTVSCDVPISFVSETTGSLNYSNIQLFQTLSNITTNSTMIRSYMNSTVTEIAINFSSDTGTGNVTMQDILAIYKRNDTISISANITGGETSDLNISWKYTPFYMTYPTGIDGYYIYPWSLSAKNIKPVGQTNSYPIFNYTLNNSGQSGKFYLAINDTNRVLVENCTETTGWTSNMGSLTVNDTIYKYGDKALNLIKSNGASADNYYYKALSVADDMSDEYINVWLYVRDITTLNKIAASTGIEMILFFNSSAFYYNQWDRSEVNTGWNLFKRYVPDMSTSGEPDITSIWTIRLDVNTEAATDLFTAGEIIMDYWFTSEMPPSCTNVTYSTTYNGSHQLLSNYSSFRYLGTGENISVWSETNLNSCDYTQLSKFEPQFLFGTICDTCVETSRLE